MADRRPASAPPSESWFLLALTLGAVSLRWLAWSRAGIMFNDGPVFIELAQAAASGDWGKLLSHPYHPLYPLAVAGLHEAVGGLSWENAAAAISIISSALCIPFLFYLLKGEFGAEAAWIGSSLFVVQSRAIAFFSDVMSDGLYACLFLVAVFCALRGRRGGGVAWFLGVGVASAAAYLTRPEGLGPLLLAGGFLLLDCLRGALPFRRILALGAVMSLSAAAIASPYLAALYADKGELTLTRKKPVSELTGLAPLARIAEVAPDEPGSDRRAEAPADSGPGHLERWWVATDELLGAIVSAARIEWLLPMLLGLWWARGRPTSRGEWLGALVLLYAFVLLGLSLHAGYVSKRHALPVLLPLLGYAGLGIPGLGRRLAAKLKRPPQPLIASLLGLILVMSLLAQLPARRSDRVAVREAAEWLADRAGDPAPVAAEKRRIAYYAAAPFVLIGSGRDRAALAQARAQGARYLVSDRSEWASLADDGEIQILHEVERFGEVARVYDLSGAR